jgi:hypothetical protein
VLIYTFEIITLIWSSNSHGYPTSTILWI